MPDESQDRIAALEDRIERLEAMLARALRPPGAEADDGPVLQAVLPDIADGQVIAAAHINAIKNSVYSWGGDVNAANFKLLNVEAVYAGHLRQPADAGYEWWVGAYAAAGLWQVIRRKLDGTSWSSAMTITTDGHVALPSMPASNPGAGSKKLWYDPADGNRVKFAP